MYRAVEHQIDDSAVGAVDRIFTDDLGWMFTRDEVREYGIDGTPRRSEATAWSPGGYWLRR
jgi:hypothetical protein